ncbi:MAG: T9SS type A sorting domain-containing protein [Bacteroidales bacterium]
MKVYPNPVHNELILESKGNTDKLNFEILNAIGQVVYKGKFIEKTIVQTINFTPGIYLIKLENGKSFEFKKIVKE